MTRTLALRSIAEVLWTGPDPGRPPWLPRRSRLTTLLPYGVAAYGLIVAIPPAAAANDSGGMTGGLFYLLALVPVAGLVLAVRRPLDGWRVVTLSWLVAPFLLRRIGAEPAVATWQWLLWIPVLVAVAWAVSRRTLIVVAAVSIAVVVVVFLLTPGRTGSLPTSVVGVLAALLVGASLGARWDARRALVIEQARTAEAQAERGALAERARIAREMHDVVGHELSTIAVRCETAPYRLGPLPPDAAAELAALAATARGALTELQRLLGVLRADGQLAERAPQPGPASLDELFAGVRAAGVDLRVHLGTPAVPDTLGLSVFRIVQQALANALQHAPGAWVNVDIRPAGGSLCIEVLNGPGAHAGSPGAGVGLIGMRERAELHAGRLQAGPTDDGGFLVLAELPLDGSRDGGAPR